MADIEKQARELLAAELRKDGSTVVAQYVLDGHDDGCTAMRAIAAALCSAPEGYALVPAPKPCECHPETCACDSQLRRSP